MELDHYNTRSTIGCSRPLIGCGIAAALVVVLVLGMLVYLLRMPAIRSVMTCRSNLTELGRALQRYYDVNHEYPASLGDLEREYLKDTQVLRCPLDIGPTKRGYVYHRPGPDSPDNFVVIECGRHKLKPGAPRSTLKLLKSGAIAVQTPPTDAQRGSGR